jgi:ABC-type phosphate/phosphonate transport system substrate-binding protein
MPRSLHFFLSFLALLLLPLSSAAEIKFAINSPRGELLTLQQWHNLAPYLEKKLGVKVKITPLLVTAIVEGANKKEYDFILANPMQTVLIREKYGYTPLTTLNQPNGPYFSGVIIAHPHSGIRQGADLRGKKVIGLSVDAAAAHVFQAYYLQQLGIDIYHDLETYREAKKLDDIVLAVKAGVFDAGFIRTGVLESMLKEGKIKAGDINVVDAQQNPEFKLLHTTTLYPEWFVSAKPGIDAALQAQMKNALLQIKVTDEVAQNANIQGFVEALPLDKLVLALKSLKIAPFEHNTP